MKQLTVLLLVIIGPLTSELFAQSIPVENNNYHYYGPNSNWGEYLKVGGNGRGTSKASVVSTNGNLHLDSKDGNSTYINHYSKGNTYLNTQGGKVGIGTTTPNSLLTLGYNNGSNQLAFKRADGNETFSMYLNPSGQIIFQNTSGGGDYDFRSNVGGRAMASTLFIEGTNGNIGFGTSSPNFALDIEGSSEGIKLGNSTGNLLFRNNIGGTNEIRSYGLALEIETRDTQDISFNSNNGNSKLVTIKGDGSGVGIGTTNPNGWKLAVNGKIRAKEIKVETGWSDFVFFNDYKLPTLDEVENHIQENGHLKDIPSAKEVEENGIFLGEMDSKLLQKIEELTLYTIQQQKEIQKLKEQKSQIEKQQNEIEKLKSLVKQLLKSKK